MSTIACSSLALGTYDFVLPVQENEINNGLSSVAAMCINEHRRFS